MLSDPQGTMTMGYAGKNGVRTFDKQECQEILDCFFRYGNEVDTARMYGEGTTEEARNVCLVV
jgi:aflatoxin B1 aldehyde reductase